MSRLIRLLPLTATVLLAACAAAPPPPPPASPSEATDLRDTRPAPINKAKGVEDVIMKSKEQQDQKLQSEENGGDASPASP